MRNWIYIPNLEYLPTLFPFRVRAIKEKIIMKILLSPPKAEFKSYEDMLYRLFGTILSTWELGGKLWKIRPVSEYSRIFFLIPFVSFFCPYWYDS